MTRLQTFFSPQSVAVVGVSENPGKLGSVIFQNILDSNYQGELYAVNPKFNKWDLELDLFKTDRQYSLSGSVSHIVSPVDLVVIVVPGKFVEGVIMDCVKNRTKNVIIVSAGFGEIGEKGLEKRIAKACADSSINLLGPNCLGVIFPHVNLNASFSDGYPAKGNIAFISQSGAFCTAVLDWAEEKQIGFSHFVSLGNKAGISEIDLIESLADDEQVKMFALYLESIKDGVKLLEAIKKISRKKPVIVLEPGESVAAQKASSSHTGALAPNSVVVREAYKEAGAIQVFSMREMFGILEMLSFGPEKNYGRRTAVITNAGGVGVLSSDLIEESALDLATLESETIEQLKQSLPAEAGLNNPIDIIGDAPANRYESALKILTQDKNVDQILVLLTPQRTTEVQKTAKLIEQYAEKTDTNIVASFVGGAQVAVGKEYLRAHKIPCFDFPSDSVQVMGLIAKSREVQSEISICSAKENKECVRCEKVEQVIKEAKSQGLKSLPAAGVKQVLKSYKLDFPPADFFTDKVRAAEFVEQLFPQKVVMKISSPDALHKTELKGVFLNIDSIEKFEEAWANLTDSIRIAKFPMAGIQIQEQIGGGTEIILGVNNDPNFGKVLLFGSGGIYTEVFHDTTIRILPNSNFGTMIRETKVGKILHGVRGESPKAVQALIETMQKVQQLVLDFPEITSIDANPVFVTADRAVCVDFKVYV